MHLLWRRRICETGKACCFGDLIYVFFAIGDLIYVLTPKMVDGLNLKYEIPTTVPTANSTSSE